MKSGISKQAYIKGGKLNALQTNILHIAESLRDKTRVFPMSSLYEECCRVLPNSEPDIERTIHELYDTGFLVEGKKLFKPDILQNEKRRKINDYINENPGAHEREIRKALDLGAYEANIHLSVLTKFAFIRNKSYKNKNIFFPLEFPEEKEMEHLLLRETLPQNIYNCIKTHTKLRPSEISEFLNIPYTTIKFHLKELSEAGVLIKTEANQATYYSISEIPLKQELSEVSMSKDLVEVKSEYDYLGGQIRFKLAIRNFTNMAIHNVSVNLNPSDQFVPDISQQSISNLLPNTTRGMDFLLTPLTCGQSKIFGSISFEDAFGKAHSITIQPKEISIKCPLVQPISATQTEVNEWIKNLKRGTSKIIYKNIPDVEAFRIGREQISALDLNEVKADPSQHWGLFSGQVKITGHNMVVKVSVANPHIILDVWADDMKQTTGFLAYLNNLINIALDISYKMVRKTEEATQKLSYLLKISKIIDELFITCKNLAPIHEITARLTTLHQLFEESFPETPLIQSVNIYNSKLQSMFDPDGLIEISIALELQSKGLDWLSKIQELYQSHIQIYQESFENFNQVSNEFSKGLDMLKNWIQEHERTYGLTIMSFLLVLDKKSGLTLFEKNLGDLKINPDLMGGFLHALQSFGREIAVSETTMKTLSYENYQFQIEPGEYIRAALIIRGPPPQFLIVRLQQFVKEFEQSFKEKIVQYTGNIDSFKGANEIFETIFK